MWRKKEKKNRLMKLSVNWCGICSQTTQWAVSTGSGEECLLWARPGSLGRGPRASPLTSSVRNAPLTWWKWPRGAGGGERKDQGCSRAALLRLPTPGLEAGPVLLQPLMWPAHLERIRSNYGRGKWLPAAGVRTLVTCEKSNYSRRQNPPLSQAGPGSMPGTAGLRFARALLASAGCIVWESASC